MSEPLVLVLHGLRLSSLATAEQIAHRWSIELDAVHAELAVAATSGWVRERTGRLAGFTLTAEGRVAGERLLAEDLDRRGAREAVVGLYRSFRPLNGRFLTVCTDWQLREVAGQPQPNDHTDAGYDAGVIERLALLHAQLAPMVGDVAGQLPRFGGYPTRMAHALARVRENELDWFTKPMIDSYHTIWFELHEDLLATLGLDREIETAKDADGPN